MVLKNKITPLSNKPGLRTTKFTTFPKPRFYSTSKDILYKPAVVYSNADLNKLEILK